MWEFAKSFRTSERSWELRKTIIAFSVLELFGIHCHLPHILAVLACLEPMSSLSLCPRRNGFSAVLSTLT